MSEQNVSISLTVKDGSKALEFYDKALGAKETMRMLDPNGGVGHAEFMLGETKIYLSEESDEWHAYAMPEGGRASCLFSVGTEDCDESYRRAVEAGGVGLNEPEDMFWGGRCSMFQDPFGYRWSFVQILEVLTPEEVKKRAKDAMGA